MKKALLLSALMVVAISPVLSEVTVIMDKGRVVGTLEMTDDSRFPPVVYSQVRSHTNPDYLLNPGGDWHYDGPPSVVMNPQTGLPEAVWSLREGYFHHVAWSQFNGEYWSDPEFLTTGIRAKDPTMWIDHDGNRRVAYWHDAGLGEIDGVYHTVLPTGETQWWQPELLSDPASSARRPLIRSFPGTGTFVAAESGSIFGLSVAVYDLPELAPGTPQRESDPWGRVMLRDADTPFRLNLTLSTTSGPGGVQLPSVSWVEVGNSDLMQGSMYFDTDSATWSQPLFEPYEPW